MLKQSTAATIKFGPFVDDTDGKTAETGLTIAQADIRLSKNGGDFAQTNNSAGATHDENGYYDIPLDTTDTNTLGRLRVSVSKSGALPVWQDFMVVTANVYDTLCSTVSLNVNVASLSNDAITAASLKADAVTEIQNGLATAAALSAVDDLVDDLESRLTAARAGYLDKLNVTGELANTSNANLFKADTASVPQNVWSYHTRLLTNIGSTVESPAIGEPLNIYRDTTVLISLTNLGAIGVDDKLWFTVKDSVEEPDEDSIIQIDRLGLLYINGAPASQVEDGSITVLDDELGNVEIKLAQRQAALLPLYEAYPAQWDIKILHSGIVSILNIGTLYIKGTPTRAIL